MCVCVGMNSIFHVWRDQESHIADAIISTSLYQPVNWSIYGRDKRKIEKAYRCNKNGCPIIVDNAKIMIS